MIAFPLLKLFADLPAKVQDLPAQALDIAAAATDGIYNAVASVPEKIASVVQFDPIGWALDYLTDWANDVLTWLGGLSGYGMLGVAGLWLVRKVWRRSPRPHVTQAATWLQWPIAADAQSIAAQLKAVGRQVEYGGPGVLLVNAWDSGNVERALQQMGIQVVK